MSLIEQLSNYGSCHRDRRNIVTHFIGIPMIVVSVAALLSKPGLVVLGAPVSLASVVAVASFAYYWKLDRRYALAMGAVLLSALALGATLASMPTSLWLASGFGLFLVGWFIQFVGHFFEGKKPAFLDDIRGLIIGPLFLVAEASFLVGLRKEVQEAIEQRIGPVHDGQAVTEQAQT
jgi:uncharacterized membrane protein YGL010W